MISSGNEGMDSRARGSLEDGLLQLFNMSLNGIFAKL
jgi:hypothetical protein